SVCVAMAFAQRDLSHGAGHVDRSGPEADHGDQQEDTVQDGAFTVFRREQREQRIARGPAGSVRNMSLPAFWLADAHPYEADEQRGSAAGCEHGPPAVARANEIVQSGREEGPHVVTGVQVSGTGGTAVLWHLFSDESGCADELSADTETGQQAKNGQFPDIPRNTAEEGKKRVTEDRERERADASEAVGEGATEERAPPTDEKNRKENTAVISEVCRSWRDSRGRQDVAHRG